MFSGNIWGLFSVRYCILLYWLVLRSELLQFLLKYGLRFLIFELTTPFEYEYMTNTFFEIIYKHIIAKNIFY